MNRRQILHAINALGLNGTLPIAALAREESLGMAPTANPARGAAHAAMQSDDTGWKIPTIGFAAVGEVARVCLPAGNDRIQHFPYLSRTVAVDAFGSELSRVVADRTVLVTTPHGLGGLDAAEPTHTFARELSDALTGLDMVILVTRPGGATGFGTAAGVAQVLHEQGTVTLGLAVMPNDADDLRRHLMAQADHRAIRRHLDGLITANHRDFDANFAKIPWRSTSAQIAPRALRNLYQSITLPVCRPGLVNVDFEDLRYLVLSHEGDCAFGFGSASAEAGVDSAFHSAIHVPEFRSNLLRHACAAMVSITAPRQSVKLSAISAAMKNMRRMMSPDAYVVYSVAESSSQSADFTVGILLSGILGT